MTNETEKERTRREKKKKRKNKHTSDLFMLKIHNFIFFYFSIYRRILAFESAKTLI